VSRRPGSLLVSVCIVFSVALLSIATNVATGEMPAGWRRYTWLAWPLLAVSLLLTTALTIWQHVLNRPADALDRGWPASRSPYPGLAAFTEEDSVAFFGREREIHDLLDRLEPVHPRRTHRFVTVVGPSGSGKSSLLCAGLIPRLRLLHRRWVVPPVMTPDRHPVERLAACLAVCSGQGTEQLRTRLTEGSPRALGKVAEEICAAKGAMTASVLLVIDQAEELFTRTGAQERAAFLDLLQQAAVGDGRLWVIASLRSEFLTDALADGHAGLFRHLLPLGVLERARLFETVEGPAVLADVRFAPGLVHEMVDEAIGGDALPLLAYTLRELYLRAGRGGVITADDYHALGGVAGALVAQADRITEELSAQGAGELILPTLLKLITVDGAAPTRRRVALRTLTDAESKVVQGFVDARLLTSDLVDGEPTVTLAHEALIRQWPPLRDEIAARYDSLRLRADLERRTQDWDHAGRPPSELLAGARLAAAQRWLKEHPAEAAGLPLVWEFVERSAHHQRAALQHGSQALANRALVIFPHDPELGLLLAIAAVEEYGVTPQATLTLSKLLAAIEQRAASQGDRHEAQEVGLAPKADGGSLVLDASCAWTAAWSPDGTRVAITLLRDRRQDGAQDGAQINDSITGTKLLTFRDGTDSSTAVGWAPDGARVVLASLLDDSTGIWDATTGEKLLPLEDCKGGVDAVAWSPDGHHVVTCRRDMMHLHDAATGAALRVLTGHHLTTLKAVHKVEWSPDGTRLITTGEEGNIALIWDVASGAKVATLRGHTAMVSSGTWAPDSRRVATASDDRTARIWDAETCTELLVIRAHQEEVIDIAWSPDGIHLATSSADGTFRVWDASGGEELLAFGGLDEDVHVSSVAWSPDSTRILTTSTDCRARIWDADRSAKGLVAKARARVHRSLTTTERESIGLP
jgi:Tol biopolymer transport system component